MDKRKGQGVEERIKKIVERHVPVGSARVHLRVKLFDLLNEMLEQEMREAVSIAREEERKQLVKYDLYGEARALDIPIDTVKKLQIALTTPNDKDV